MGEGSYCNFDLILERFGDRYRARVLDSPAGQASAPFGLPFSELELENFVLRMGRPRSDVRRIDSVEMDAVKKCGERLFRSVFTEDVNACFLRSRDIALEEGKGLRVRLRIDVPEFHDYPWELLYNAHLNQFLALSRETPVVRYLEMPYPVQPLTVRPPLKILVMISSPQRFPPLNVEEEWRRLNSALVPLIRRGLVSLERLAQPTLSALQQHLRRGEYHIFHFIGHGKYSEHKQEGLLLLEDEAGQGRPVSGQYLGTVLHDHRSLRLVVLNACEGARTSREDPYAGVAQTLVQQGIPAVIAMQFEILETAAITFAQEFYGAVVDGLPVDAAVSEARKAIFATGNDVEWGTPVLYMRTPQGAIFEIPGAHHAVPVPVEETIPYVDHEAEQKLEQLYTEGLAAFWVEDWDKACDRFQKILKDRPDHAGASGKLEEATRQRHLSLLYTRAVDAQKTEDWPEALKVLEQLLKDSPAYKDAPAMLKAVTKQKQLSELYAEARQLHAGTKWQAVVSVFARIESIDPAYPDPENLLATAQKGLEELERQAKLNELYSRAVHAMDAGRWEDAQGLLTQLQDIQPGFMETEGLLSRVEARIRQLEQERERRDQIGTLYEQAHGLLRSRQWAKTLEKIKEIHRLDEEFEDSEKLAEQAQQELAREEAEAERQNELAAMYAEALRLARDRKHREALQKWEEIRNIDPGYPDRQFVENTARKGLMAQEESARQGQDARRQRQLAAMYLEAVGLVRAEKYQEALDKWKELRGLDPGYPDRQYVERTARKSLAAATEPIPAPRKITVPRALWIGLGGLVTVAAAVLILINRAANCAPSFYDDFESSSFNGRFDPGRWQYGENPKGAAVQEAGSLIFTQGGIGQRTSLDASRYQGCKLADSIFLEARLKIDSTSHGFLSLGSGLDVDGGRARFGFNAWLEGAAAHCWDRSERSQRGDYSVPVPYGSWHVFRLELDLERNEVRCLIDGRQFSVDRYEHPLRNSHIWVGLNVDAPPDRVEPTSPVRGYVDYVRIGPLPQPPPP